MVYIFQPISKPLDPPVRVQEDISMKCQDLRANNAPVLSPGVAAVHQLPQGTRRGALGMVGTTTIGPRARGYPVSLKERNSGCTGKIKFKNIPTLSSQKTCQGKRYFNYSSCSNAGFARAFPFLHFIFPLLVFILSYFLFF